MQRTLRGRQASIEKLNEALERRELIVVVGAVGVGKSALARARYEQEEAHDDAQRWWCELRHATTREQVLSALASSLDASLFSQDLEQDPAEHLERLLSSRPQALLVLDNAEGCAEPLSQLLESWAAHGSLPRTIVTSRRQLALAEARHLPLEGLEPDAARALFIERASLRAPGMLSAPSAAELKTLDALLERLDYMPLAIELFAARAGAFGLDALLEELVEVAHMRDPSSPGGHSSLADALRLSWRLLKPQALEFLRQSAIFEGSFELDAAREVIALEPGTSHMATIAELIERSLLRRDDDLIARKTRYAPYYSVRELLLSDAPRVDDDALLIRYARFTTARAAQEVSRLDGHDAIAAIEALRRAEPELRRVADDARVPAPLRLEAQRALALLRMRVGPAQALIQGLDDAVRLAQHNELQDQELSLRVTRLQALNLLSLVGRIREDAQAIAAMPNLSPTQQIDAALWGASDMVCTGRLDEAIAQIDALLWREDATGPQRAMILVAAMVTATTQGDWSKARGLDTKLELECNLAHTSLHDRLAMLRARSIWAALHEESARQVVELSQDMLGLVDALMYHSVRPEILTQAALAYAQLGQVDRAHAMFEEAIADADLHGMRGTQARALLHLGRDVLLGLGAPQAALERLEEARYVARHAGMKGRVVRCELAIFDALLALAQLDLARQRLDALAYEISQSSYQDAQDQLAHRMALLAFVEDRPSDAIPRWEALEASDGPLRATAQLYLIAALARDGELELAQARLAKLPELGRGSCASRQRRALLSLFVTPRVFRQEGLERALELPMGCPERAWLVPMLRGEPLTAAHAAQEAKPAALTEQVAAPTLTVGPHAHWIKLPDEDEPLDLERKVVLARIVEGLVVAWEQEPGQGLDVEQILELGWPGQTILPSAGANRVYVAMNNLRKLGLDPLLIRGQQGYMLSPHVHVLRADDPSR